MAQSSRTFRVFVSSTFSDLQAEHDALRERVFPRLRGLAGVHGCRFQAIDLRWGVSEEAALDQPTMKICRGEIARCQKSSPRPNFIVLLGERYGWRPLPSEIPANEFAEILPSVTEQEWGVLQPWHRQDDNSTPPVYCLQPRSGEYVEFTRWEQTEAALRHALLAAVSKLPFSLDAARKYTTSATEHEIAAGAMNVAPEQAALASPPDGKPERSGRAVAPQSERPYKFGKLHRGDARRSCLVQTAVDLYVSTLSLSREIGER